VTVYCQNGLTANDRSLIASFTIPGSTRKIALRKGWVSVVLLDWLGFWHAEIEPLDTGVLDDWGYAERLIRGSATEVSNHAGGGAGDANALKHPLGTDPARNFTPGQLAKMRARVPLYRGVLRSGAFYTGRKDGMHGEIDQLANGPAVAAQIQTGWLAPGVRSYLTGTGPTAAPMAPVQGALVVDGDLGKLTITRWQQIMGTPVDGVISKPKSSLIVKVQEHLNAHLDGQDLVVDGDLGPKTIRALQRYLGTPVDGKISKPSSAMVKALQGRLNAGWF
jgi:hypothetical protein